MGKVCPRVLSHPYHYYGAALAYGFIVGDFWKDGGELMDNPWGIVSLFDVYVGFFFFIGWIAYRESCPGIVLPGPWRSAWAAMWSPESMRLSLCSKARANAQIFLWEKIKETRMSQQNVN